MTIGKMSRVGLIGVGLYIALPALAGTSVNTTGAAIDRRFVMSGSASCYTALHISEITHSWAHGPDNADGTIINDVFDFGTISATNPPTATTVGGTPYVLRDSTDGGINLHTGVYVSVDSMGCAMNTYSVTATYDTTSDVNISVIMGSYTSLDTITAFNTATYVLPYTGAATATVATGTFDLALGEETVATLDVGVHLPPLALANPFSAGVRFTLTPAF